MEDLYKLSEDFVEFVPKTAKEAVLMFNRMTRGWSVAQWDRTPELLIKCAKGLHDKELDMFEQWVMAPTIPIGVANAPMPTHADGTQVTFSEQKSACSSKSPKA